MSEELYYRVVLTPNGKFKIINQFPGPNHFSNDPVGTVKYHLAGFYGVTVPATSAHKAIAQAEVLICDAMRASKKKPPLPPPGRQIIIYRSKGI